MILDLMVILILALVAFIGMKRGGVKTLLSLIATVASFLLALFLAGYLAELIYSAFISPNIIKSVGETLAQSTEQSYQSVSDSFPQFLNEILVSDGINLDAIVSSFGAESAGLAARAVEAAVSPTIVSLITLMLEFLLFIIIRMIFSALIRLVNAFFRLPVLRHINGFLGAVCGIVEGLVVICLLTFVVEIISSGQTPPEIFTPEYIEASYLYKYFYYTVSYGAFAL